MDDPLYNLAEVQRRLANLIRKGRVHSWQAKPPRVRVEYAAGCVTAWLPYHEGRAGTVRNWDPPAIGEQCTILSESGDLNNGTVLLGLNTTKHAPPSDNPDEHVSRYDDGTELRYNRATQHLTISVLGGTTELVCDLFKITAQVELTGDINQTGSHTSSGDQVAGGVSQTKHKHLHGSPYTSKPVR